MIDSISFSPDMMANLSECEVGDEKTLLVPVRMTGQTEFQVTGPPNVEPSGEEEGSTYAESPEKTGVAPGVSQMIAQRGKY